MIEQSLRQSYQRIFIDPFLQIWGHKISPIFITFLAAIFGLLFIPAFLTGHAILAICLLLASGYCDTLDGSLARHQQKTTPLGSVLDIMADRLVEFSVILAFYLINPIQNGLASFMMLGSILLCVTSFLVVGIFTENSSNKSFHYSPGIMERAEAFVFFILMILLPQYFVLLALVFSGLVCLTALIRLTQFAISNP